LHAWLTERKPERERVSTSRMTALLVGDPPFAREAREGLSAPAFSSASLASPETQAVPAGLVWRSAVAGNAEALDRLPRLPGSREEIDRVKRLLPHSRVLVGREASEEALVRLASAGQLARFRLLHFATHALVDDRAPERSALVLSRVGLPDPVERALGGGRAFDGLLRAVEITREWRLDADLVTLSGCRTGLGKKTPGEGYLGLAHAFFQVGARSLLVSLWEVDDEAAALLMGRFYEGLTGSYREPRDGRTGAPMAKTEALQEAKRWLRTFVDEDGTRPYEHPVYWSPFVMIGDPD
jgi:CHAT domain-containing protein